MYTEQNKKSLDDYLEKSFQSKLANNMAYDRALLTLSSTAIALSLTINSTFLSFDESICLILIKSCWWFFLFSIIFTLTSYPFANKSIEDSVEVVSEYYAKPQGKPISLTNTAGKIALCLTHLSGLSFILGLSCIVIFVSINVN